MVLIASSTSRRLLCSRGIAIRASDLRLPDPADVALGADRFTSLHMAIPTCRGVRAALTTVNPKNIRASRSKRAFREPVAFVASRMLGVRVVFEVVSSECGADSATELDCESHFGVATATLAKLLAGLMGVAAITVWVVWEACLLSRDVETMAACTLQRR